MRDKMPRRWATTVKPEVDRLIMTLPVPVSMAEGIEQNLTLEGKEL